MCLFEMLGYIIRHRDISLNLEHHPFLNSCLKLEIERECCFKVVFKLEAVELLVAESAVFVVMAVVVVAAAVELAQLVEAPQLAEFGAAKIAKTEQVLEAAAVVDVAVVVAAVGDDDDGD